jgi:hypothetical protein
LPNHRAKETEQLTTIKTAEDIAWHRRRFLGAAGVTVAAAQFGIISWPAVQPTNT